jgi:hypothetical protein
MANDRKPSLTSLIAFAIIVSTVYVLSYAPVVRISWKWQLVTPSELFKPLDGEELPIFRPVDWLIDETPLQEPLFAWADLCGVRTEFEFAANGRRAGSRDPADAMWVNMY